MAEECEVGFGEADYRVIGFKDARDEGGSVYFGYGDFGSGVGECLPESEGLVPRLFDDLLVLSTTKKHQLSCNETEEEEDEDVQPTQHTP